MQTGRPDLDAMLKVSTIPSNEPVFILRAQDGQAADTVRDWAARHVAAGGSRANAESALDQADAMDRWPIKKVPGDDHIDDGDRKQLEYEYAQRAWRARDDAADLSLRLAEERARADARNEMLALVRGPIGREILGWPNFRCGPFAQLFRLTGEDIKARSEDEQAFILAWFLSLALRHGEGWRDAADRELERRQRTLDKATPAALGEVAP